MLLPERNDFCRRCQSDYTLSVNLHLTCTIQVLERARKAESEAQSYKTQLKQEAANAKRSIREMEMALAESTALSAKSEREYITLRDSMKHMVDGWKADVERLKEEMARKEQGWKREAEQLGNKYQDVYKFVQEERSVFSYPLTRSSLKRAQG